MKKSLILLILITIMSINGYAQKKAPPYKPLNKNEQKKAPPSAPVQRVAPSSPSNNVSQTQQPSQPVKKKRGKRSSVSYARSSGFHQGDKLINLGVGLSSGYYFGGTPIGLSYESGISDDISVGAQFDYNAGNSDRGYRGIYDSGYSAYYLGVRGSYHLNNILQLNESKVDLYAGVGLGYVKLNWADERYRSYYSSYYYRDYNSGLWFNYYVGGKYYFTPKVGAFVELGYTGLSSSRVGISFKF
jgi:hypothetical protein